MGTDRTHSLGARAFRPEESSALVLRSLKAGAGAWPGEKGDAGCCGAGRDCAEVPIPTEAAMLLEAFARKMLLAPMLAVLAGLPGSEAASPSLRPPHTLYECGLTRISKSGTRLEDARTRLPIPGSGSAIWFENGGYQVSYDEIPAIHRAQPGDPAFMCLVHLPPGCPPGDERGRVFTTTDLRTLESWTLANSEHSCGGA